METGAFKFWLCGVTEIALALPPSIKFYWKSTNKQQEIQKKKDL